MPDKSIDPTDIISPDDPALPSLAGYRPSPLHAEIAHRNADPDTIRTRAELEAIADTVLGEGTPERRLWGALHDPRQWQSDISGMAHRAGMPQSNVALQARIGEIFGKMESATGVLRARSIEIFTGFTTDRIKAGVSSLMDCEDDRIRVKAHDLASKIAGLTPPGTQVNVNTQVNVSVTPQCDPLVDEAIADE